jgi:hypothetical protein
VSGGTLCLKGSVLSLTLLRKKRKGKWRIGDPEHGMFTNTSTFLLDDEGDPACGHGKTIHAVACAENWSGQTIYLLLAERDHGSGDYSRVGILFQDDMDDKLRIWRNSLPRRSFQIV